MDHREKLRLAGIKRHGSEEAWREFLRQAAAKSSRNKGGTGGFAYMKLHDPEKLSEISRRAGKHGKPTKKP